MPVYAKKISTTDARFTGRATHLYTAEDTTIIPVPDEVVLCNGCNQNLYPETGYLIYLDKRKLVADRPYDIYCEGCLRKYFKGYKEVDHD